MTAAHDFSAMPTEETVWHCACTTGDLVTNSGVCALIENEQVAIFHIKMNGESQIYAIGNFDPIGNANVLYRGLLGSIGGAPVVASPLYKEHYFLETGLCKERDDVSVRAFKVKVEDGNVYIAQ